VEDLLHPELFVAAMNGAYSLKGTANEITAAKLDAADATERRVKKAEALFKLMPPAVPEFSHYAPAEWLLRNPAVLDGDGVEVSTTLDRFEAVMKAYNKLIA
jgi:hypothetical protein